MTRLEALVEARALGLSARETADRFGVSERTVRRWRASLLPGSSWTPTTPEHGTRARYRRGCACGPCRAANALETANHRRVYRRALRARQEAATTR